MPDLPRDVAWFLPPVVVVCYLVVGLVALSFREDARRRGTRRPYLVRPIAVWLLSPLAVAFVLLWVVAGWLADLAARGRGEG